MNPYLAAALQEQQASRKPAKKTPADKPAVEAEKSAEKSDTTSSKEK